MGAAGGVSGWAPGAGYAAAAGCALDSLPLPCQATHTHTQPRAPADEDMFTATDNSQFSPHMPAEVFACTVGQKPSKAPFYVNDPTDVVATLSKLAEARAAPAPASPSVSFA